MKTVLIIAYFFPPSNDAGVHRTLRFVKYLPRYNWKPIILTVNNGNFGRYDPSLMNQLPKTLDIYRARSWEPLRFWARLIKFNRKYRYLSVSENLTV